MVSSRDTDLLFDLIDNLGLAITDHDNLLIV